VLNSYGSVASHSALTHSPWSWKGSSVHSAGPRQHFPSVWGEFPKHLLPGHVLNNNFPIIVKGALLLPNQFWIIIGKWPRKVSPSLGVFQIRRVIPAHR